MPCLGRREYGVKVSQLQRSSRNVGYFHDRIDNACDITGAEKNSIRRVVVLLSVLQVYHNCRDGVAQYNSAEKHSELGVSSGCDSEGTISYHVGGGAR